jgi:flavin reductase (DIM6/NTAB) family NADH-FMN oxidoreductase RutF
MSFKELDPKLLQDNPFKIIDDDWMLVSAGDEKKFNTMTASWGGLGIMWFKNVSFVVVRPSRYTFEFMEQQDYYSLSFFEEDYRDVLSMCGSKSGRDIDKIKESGLTPAYDKNAPYFDEAKLVMVCKKLYWQDMTPDNFLADFMHEKYPNGDYHRLYIGEITDLLVK